MDQPSLNPAWFAAVMGTAGMAVVGALNPSGVPQYAEISRWLGIAFLTVALAMFVGLSALAVGPRRPRRHHLTSPDSGPAYATVPGAILVILAAAIALFPSALLNRAGWAFLAGAALVGIAMAVTFTIVLFVAAFEHEDFRAEDISGIWFVPETAVLLGAVVLSDLASTGAPVLWIRTLAVVALILTGIGAVLFAFTAAVFINRLILHSQLHSRGAPAMWIMLSPLSVTALALHKVASGVEFLTPSQIIGIQPVADLMAALLWGFSLWWIAAAGLLTWNARRAALTQSPADWGYVFPAAALTIATLVLSTDWQSGVVTFMGFLLSAGLAAVWALVALTTLGRAAPLLGAARRG